ncbi:MAG: hypothetical protein RMX99_022575 [Aulosira sp. DedVER01a]
MSHRLTFEICINHHLLPYLYALSRKRDDSKVELANLNPISKTFDAVNELSAEQKSNNYIAVSAFKIGTALYEDIQNLAEGGGRLNFSEVIKHRRNTIGKVLADVI